MTRQAEQGVAAPGGKAPRTVPQGTGTVAFRLGAVSVELAGGRELLAPLARELDTAIARPSAAPADLRLVFAPSATGEPPVAGAHRSRFPFTHVAGASAGRSVYELRPMVGPALYRVSLLASFDRPAPWEATVAVPAPSRWLRRLLDPPTRALSRDCSSLAAVVAKNVVDEIIDPLLWLRLLPSRGVLAHASAVVTPDDRGILLLGPGGAGKTQTMLHLVAGGCRYLSDDRTALLEGRLHGHPKLLRLSGYHVTSLPPIERSLLAGRSGSDTALWRTRKALLGAGRVGRRARPEAALGPSRVAGSAPLAAAFLMEAAPAGSGVTVSPVTADELSARAASMVCNQFWDVLRYVSLLSAGGAAVPSVGDLHARTAATFVDNLTAVSLYRIGVPPHVAWTRVADAVRTHAG